MKIFCFKFFPNKIVNLFVLLLFANTVFSQPKTLVAVRTTEQPVIDGMLMESFWKNVPVATDFIQNQPEVGKPSAKKTEVRVAYDDEAIYIGAMMYDDPALIRKQLTARDEEDFKDIDYFAVFFDTYHDKQNGFGFLVSAANVQTDAKLSSGEDNNRDKSWDAVWTSEVKILSDGWSVEMRIPYISLRFANKDIQNWGIQFARQIRRFNENSYWNEVKPELNGFVDQFGIFMGITNLQPPLRLSFSPYLSTGFRSSPDEGDSYHKTWLRSGGLDLKYGVNESFTLDATLIPDFGQVVSDNAVNNLTPYEVQFEENRQFFTEGTELFNKAGLFYSRRIGARPSGYYTVREFAGENPQWKLLDNPSLTQLYNAVKFSGRNKHNLGIGVFNGITAPMYARLRNDVTKRDTSILTAPLMNYNILVLDQALKGRSSVTFTNTNVMRNGYYQDANLSSLDFSLFDKTQLYNVRGRARYSKSFSSNNPNSGFNTALALAKVGGNWQYFVQTNIESDQYDANDLGYLYAPNEVSVEDGISYWQYNPGKVFQTYNFSFNSGYERLYKPTAYTDLWTEFGAFGVFRNYWDVNFKAGYNALKHDYFVLGNPATYRRFVQRPAFTYYELSGSTDSRRKLFYAYEFTLHSFIHPMVPKHHYELYSSMRYRFNEHLSMDISYSFETESNYIISAGRESDGSPLVAFVDYTEESTILSGTYNFTPRLNLTLRLRHYLSRVRHNTLAKIGEDGVPQPLSVLTESDNVNIFNADAFLTWDFRPGSRVVLGFKNWLGPDKSVDLQGKENNYFNNLNATFTERHGNEISVRFIYFLDYNQLKKQKIKG